MARLINRSWLALGLAAASLACAGVIGGCSKNVAGRSSFTGLGYSREEEIALGAQAAPQMVQEFGGEVANPALRGYVTEIGARLAALTEGSNPALPWTFTLLNSDVINAFALPGGKVFISRGLAEKMSNEAQLAGVLGHEIGHVTARHTSERVSQARTAQIGAAVAGAILGAAGGDTAAQIGGYAFEIGGQTILLKYSRDQESEADALGMRYMARAGYNPLGQRQVMEILAREAGAGSAPEFFATHPSPQTRIARVQKLLDTTFKDTQNNPQYQLFEDRFRTGFLAKLAALPPAPGALDHAAAGPRLALGDPESWCAICAARRARSMNP